MCSGVIKNLGVVDSYIKGGSSVGGLVGSNSGTVSNSYATGAVTGDWYVGGLVGSNGSQYYGGTVSNSYATGAVTGSSYVGGLVGSNSNGSQYYGGTVSNSYATGAVTGSSNVGGLVGAYGTVSNSYYNSQTSGRTDTGKGEGKTTAEMQSNEFTIFLNAGATALSMNAWIYEAGKYPVLSNTPANFNFAYFFASGDGTEANPYIIKTKEHLENISFWTNFGNDFNGKYFKLGNDIALNDTTDWQDWETTPPANTWTAIGNGYKNPFRGTFDGGGYVVSGVYNQGLFGYLGEDGIINNVGVMASYIKDGGWYGGLVGWNSGTVSNSYSTGTVTGGGGLVGYNEGTIINSYSTGTVTGGAMSRVGGLVGRNAYGTIINSYAAGMVTGTTFPGSVGGLVGDTFGGTVSNSYYDKETSGQTDTGRGEGKTTAEMQSQDFANLLNAKATALSMNAWAYSEGKYPTLTDSLASTINTANYFASGDGTAANPYIIKTKGQLEVFSFFVNSLEEDFSGEYIKLGNDIVLNDITGWQNWETTPPAYIWNSIGESYNNSFKGTFDGDGYVVSGVYINTTSYYQGLFRYLGDGGTIKNLGVVNFYIKGGNYVGSLVGSNYRGTVSNSYSIGTVKGGSNIGGLVGQNEGAVSNSYSTSAVTGTSGIGGLVGVNYSGGTVSNSYYDKETSRQTDTGKGEGKTTAEMQTEEFVRLLNVEATTLSMNAWVYSTGKYPTLSSELANVTPIISHRVNPSIGSVGVQTIGNAIILSNLPQNAKVKVFGLNGKQVGALPATPSNGALRINVQTKGMYIVRINNQTLKVTVR